LVSGGIADDGWQVNNRQRPVVCCPSSGRHGFAAGSEKEPLHMQLTKIRANFIIWGNYFCQVKLYLKLWIGFLFYEKHLDRIYLIFLLSHFPEENEKTQSDFVGNNNLFLEHVFQDLINEILDHIPRAFSYCNLYRGRRLEFSGFLQERLKKNP
jgi:hypothetical protein